VSERPHCQALTKAGTPCGTTVGLSAAGVCLSHDPERAAMARELRAAGGRAAGAAARERKAALKAQFPRVVPPVPKNLEDATKYFAWLVDMGATGQMDARTVHECAFALKGFQSAAEKRDLEREIKKLREELKAARASQSVARVA